MKKQVKKFLSESKQIIENFPEKTKTITRKIKEMIQNHSDKWEYGYQINLSYMYIYGTILGFYIADFENNEEKLDYKEKTYYRTIWSLWLELNGLTDIVNSQKKDFKNYHKFIKGIINKEEVIKRFDGEEKFDEFKSKFKISYNQFKKAYIKLQQQGVFVREKIINLSNIHARNPWKWTLSNKIIDLIKTKIQNIWNWRILPKLFRAWNKIQKILFPFEVKEANAPPDASPADGEEIIVNFCDIFNE